MNWACKVFEHKLFAKDDIVRSRDALLATVEDHMDWATVKSRLQLLDVARIADLLLRRLSILLDCWSSRVLFASIGQTLQILDIDLVGS